MFAFRSSLGPVELAFTDRYGGVSGVPYDELNLAMDGNDAIEARAENMRRAVAAFAPDVEHVVEMRQVHGNHVDLVEDRHVVEPPDADGMVTGRRDAVLVVRAADCVPLLLADPDAGLIGVAHAGRPGLAAGVAGATVTRMRDLGAGVITAWIGPYVCGSCYEVPAAMQADVGALVPEAVATTSWGTPSLDIGVGVRAQLEALGVAVIDQSVCTRESADLYSYRRDGDRAGRHAGLIRLRG